MTTTIPQDTVPAPMTAHDQKTLDLARALVGAFVGREDRSPERALQALIAHEAPEYVAVEVGR